MIRRFFVKFFLNNGILYKHNHDSTLLWCIDKSEVERIMVERITLAPTLVDTPWLKRSCWQDTIGPPWKQTVISILELVTNSRSMLTKYMCLGSLE